MTVAEIKAAINFGKDTIEAYKKNRNGVVPVFVYDRMIELYEELANKLENGEE